MEATLRVLNAVNPARRRVLSKAPFEEKIALLIRLQEMAAVIAANRGQILRPWRNAGKGSHCLKFQNFSLILNGKMDFSRTMPGDVVQTSSGPQPRWGW